MLRGANSWDKKLLILSTNVTRYWATIICTAFNVILLLWICKELLCCWAWACFYWVKPLQEDRENKLYYSILSLLSYTSSTILYYLYYPILSLLSYTGWRISWTWRSSWGTWRVSSPTLQSSCLLARWMPPKGELSLLRQPIGSQECSYWLEHVLLHSWAHAY